VGDAGLVGLPVLVAGTGVSGRAAQAALLARGARVRTFDDADDDADTRDVAALDAARLVVASPGLPPHHPLLAAAVQRGIPVWSEIELAWRLRAERGDRGPAPWLAVTGTNGKTTTVGMLAAILTAAGEVAPAVGNVGPPAVEAAADPDNDVLAVELSSFQLHFTHGMAAEAAAVLNIAPDHLDWHGDLDAYAAAKARIYRRVRLACVYAAADPRLESLVRDAEVAEGARAVGVTLGVPGPGQLGIVEDALVDRAFHAAVDDPFRTRRADELATTADLAHLAGPGGLPPHVLTDALTAAALARAHGVPASAVAAGLRSFRSGAHRTQHVGTLDGVHFVDDSKATNAHAAAAALSGFAPGTVVWIAGGLAKGARFDDLVSERADRLRGVVVIGVDPEPWLDALARHAPAIPVVTIDPADTGVMTRAVTQARRLAQAGDTVLLAPAGASMDQFRSYADRGESFARVVAGLGSDPGGAGAEIPAVR
jgi:UDP-N-acetylmuramoylalanine--D-glutamate ligase